MDSQWGRARAIRRANCKYFLVFLFWIRRQNGQWTPTCTLVFAKKILFNFGSIQETCCALIQRSSSLYSRIHLKDLTGLVVHSIENEKVQGILNGVAPEIINNQACHFSKIMKELSVVDFHNF